MLIIKDNIGRQMIKLRQFFANNACGVHCKNRPVEKALLEDIISLIIKMGQQISKSQQYSQQIHAMLKQMPNSIFEDEDFFKTSEKQFLSKDSRRQSAIKIFLETQKHPYNDTQLCELVNKWFTYSNIPNITSLVRHLRRESQHIDHLGLQKSIGGAFQQMYVLEDNKIAFIKCCVTMKQSKSSDIHRITQYTYQIEIIQKQDKDLIQVIRQTLLNIYQ